MKTYKTHVQRKHVPVITAVALILSIFFAAIPSWAQQQKTENVPEFIIDPIGFRGPNPAEQYKEIYIDQKLGAQVPLDLVFTNEKGEDVRLGNYFGEKPVVLALVYYECPMLCTLVLNGMVAGFDSSANNLKIGEDYDVVTISIDPGETAELAREKKTGYLAQLDQSGAELGWHFLTGGENAIEDVAQAVGFRYYYEEKSDQYAHASGIMILTPGGKVSSYYLGIEYLPENLRIALTEAADGTIGSLVDQLILLCFRYDPTKGTYGLVIMSALRLGGAATVLSILAFWLVSYRLGKKKQRSGEQGHHQSHTV